LIPLTLALSHPGEEIFAQLYRLGMTHTLQLNVTATSPMLEKVARYEPGWVMA
jgi:hypothetical protein